MHHLTAQNLDLIEIVELVFIFEYLNIACHWLLKTEF